MSESHGDGGKLTPAANDHDEPEASETLEKVPESGRLPVEQFFGAAMSIGNPILQKITSEHISDLISLNKDDSQRRYADRREARRILAVVGVVFLLVLVGFAVLLVVRDQRELLLELLKAAVLFLGGLGAGWGLQSFRQRER